MYRKQLAFILLSSLTALSALPFAIEAKADDGPASDSMWIDPDAQTLGQDAKGKGGAVASLHGGSSPTIVAPMCSAADFKGSSFLQKNSWPGVGPFKASQNDANEFMDDAQNHLKLDVSADQVSSAELGLNKLGGNASKDFLDLEMTADFLLEALGAKPRKISEFNAQMEKNRDAIKKGRNISLAAGRYQVTLERGKGVAPYACLISVNSLDAAKSLIKEHSGSDENPDEVAAKPDTPAVVKKLTDLVKKPITAKPKTPATNTSPAATTASSTGDSRRDEFVNTIKSWQQIKKVALKKRDTSHLSEILGGAALAKQSNAVKWLQDNQKYYDMEPRGCVVDKYTDLGAGKKYAVVAQVKEFSKYMDESSARVLKEVDDKYTVNYTMEKQGDKWIIMDSSVLSTSSVKAPSGSGNTNKAH